MLNYLRCENGKFTPVAAQDILADDKPFSLFLGGLLHLNGKEHGKTLAGLLTEMSPSTVYIATRAAAPDIGGTAADMYAFELQEKLSIEAKALVSDLLLPQEILQGSAGLQDKATLRAHLSRIHLIGYSYGTSLIQQAETIMLDKLGIKASQNVALGELQDVARCMGALAAVNIGPVASPLMWTPEGKIQRYDRRQEMSPVANGFFSQYFTLRATDRVSQDAIGHRLTGNLPASRKINVYGTPSSVFVCDATGDEWLRRIGINKLPSGTVFPLVQHSIDCEGHNLLVYTNTLKILRESGVMAIYPSLATGGILKSACRAMVDESNAVRSGSIRTFHLDAAAPLRERENVREIDRNLRRLHRLFNAAVKEYVRADLPQGVEAINKNLREVETLIPAVR